MNREQRVRRKVRDRKKFIEQAASSISHDIDPSKVLSLSTLHDVAAVSQSLGLRIISLIALEAMKVGDLKQRLMLAEKEYIALNARLLVAFDDLKKAQETIAKMNLRYQRRGTKKARTYHPEKKR